ncbi:MAG: GyrI-like domain-containing protein [Myxococcota bacterium]
MNVTVDTLPARRLATLRHTGPYAEIGGTFHRLAEIAARTGLFDRIEPAVLALYHDDPERTPAAELRADAGYVVLDDAPLPGELTELTLAPGRYARASHIGPYSGLPAAWRALLREWLPASGHHHADGPSYEVYVDDPRTTPAEALRTDLLVPLR